MKFLVLILCSPILAQFNTIGGFGSAGGFLWRPGSRNPAAIGVYAPITTADNTYGTHENQEEEEFDDAEEDAGTKLTYQRPSYSSQTYQRPLYSSQTYQRPSYNRYPGVVASSAFCKNQIGGYTPCHLLRN